MTNLASVLCVIGIALCISYFVVVGIVYAAITGGVAAIVGIVLGGIAACAAMFVYGSEHTASNG